MKKRVLLFCALCFFSVVHADAFDFEASALFFKAHENGLTFGVVIEGDFENLAFESIIPDAVSLNTVLYNPKFSRHTGYRFGLGYRSDCTPFLLLAKGFHYKAEACGAVSSHYHNGKGSFFLGTWSQPVLKGLRGLPEATNFATGDAEACYQLNTLFKFVDVEGGYPLHLTSCFELTPRIGVRFGKILQCHHLVNHYFFKNPEEEPIEIDEIIGFKNNFKGAGLLGGLKSDWHLFCGFSAFACLDVSLLKGYFHLFECYERDWIELTKFVYLTNQKNRLSVVRPIADLALGLGYERQICCLTFKVSLAYEMHHYFGQNQLTAFVVNNGLGLYPIDDGDRGDLSLQGISLNFNVLF